MPKNRLISGTSKLYHNLRPWVKQNISGILVVHETVRGMQAFMANARTLHSEGSKQVAIH